MCPTVENQEEHTQYLGKNRRNEDVYAFIVDLQTADILDPIFFDLCLGKAAEAVKLAFPNAAPYIYEKARCRFKWVGYPDKLVVFSEAFVHIDVRDQVLERGFVLTKARGAGKLDITPEGKLIRGYSGTLLDAKAFTELESNSYKLDYLPTRLGREHFTYER